MVIDYQFRNLQHNNIVNIVITIDNIVQLHY